MDHKIRVSTRVLLPILGYSHVCCGNLFHSVDVVFSTGTGQRTTITRLVVCILPFSVLKFLMLSILSGPQFCGWEVFQKGIMSELVKRGLPLRFSGDPTTPRDEISMPSARGKPSKVAEDITAVLNLLIPPE